MIEKRRRTKILCLAVMILLLGLQGLCQPDSLRAATINIDTIDPVILVEKISSEQAVAGGEFTMTLSLRNISNNPGFQLKLSFKIKDTDSLTPFTLKTTQATAIEQLDGNQNMTVMMTFAVDPTAQNKDYEMLVMLNGKNALMQDTVNAGINIKVPVTYDLTKPVLLVKTASVSPEQPNLSEGFDLCLTLGNLSKTTDARNILALLDGGDNFEVLDISNKKNMVMLGKNEEAPISYQLRAKDTKSGNSVKLKLSYDYHGDKSESVEETINLPLPQDEMSVGATPWVIVNKYLLSAEQVLAGNTVTLSLFIENTNQRPVKNVKISLGVIKIEESSGTTSTTTTGGTVFSPVNSSNSFYVDSIPGKTIIQKDVDLYVDPNAAAKTYIVPVEIKYEDRKGTTLTGDELVNIPVTQECKLQVLSLQTPPMGFLGQPVPVMAEFVNVGKVVLGNFMVSLEGDFQKENGSYYVGNLDMGVSDFFQGSVIPQSEGTLEGNLVFTYIDNNNKDVRIENPFTMEIQPASASPAGDENMELGGPLKPGMGMDGRPGASGGFIGQLKSKWPVILLGAVILLEGLYIWRLRRKKTSEDFFNE